MLGKVFGDWTDKAGICMHMLKRGSSSRGREIDASTDYANLSIEAIQVRISQLVTCLKNDKVILMRFGWSLRAWETSRLRIAWGKEAITSFNLQLTNS